MKFFSFFVSVFDFFVYIFWVWILGRVLGFFYVGKDWGVFLIRRRDKEFGVVSLDIFKIDDYLSKILGYLFVKYEKVGMLVEG